MEIEVEEGNTDLTAWFEMKDGQLCNAFYVYVERME